MMEIQEPEAFAVLSDEDFRQALADNLRQLRAFAYQMCGSREDSDDLVQETMLKAWRARDRFHAGTNFRAWCFTILRNHFCSLARRNRFHGEWDDLQAERILAAPANQDVRVQLSDALRALQQLPTVQREAVILVGAGGHSYEEAAQICGVAIGTIKSRVARGRTALKAIIDSGILANARSQTIGEASPVLAFTAHVEMLKASKQRFMSSRLAA